MSDARGIDAAIAQLRAAEAVMRSAATYGAQAYAGLAGFRGRGIVSRHFTAGNQQRYRWQPLTRAHFLAKAKGIKRKGGNALLPGRKRGVKLDPAAEFQSSTGELVGIGSGTNKPMLVASGELRDAVEDQARVVPRGTDAVALVFTVPEHGVYHHTGAGHNPKRSPVEPNAEDVAMIAAEVQRKIDTDLGRGRTTFTPPRAA